MTIESLWKEIEEGLPHEEQVDVYERIVTLLERERDEALEECDRWKALVETRQASFCVHCGTKFSMGPEGVAEFKSHIAECNNHPLHPLAKELDTARKVANALLCHVCDKQGEYEYEWLTGLTGDEFAAFCNFTQEGE